MCKAVEVYANELFEERAKVIAEEHTIETVKIVKNMLEGGITIETALKFANLDLQTYEKYSGKAQ